MLTRQAIFSRSGMPPVVFKALNFVGFQSIWMLGVFYGNRYLAISAALIALHFLVTPQRQRDMATLITVAAVGICVDSIFTLTGIFVFDTLIIPPWLVLLWCGFALTLQHSLQWLSRFPLALQSALGAFGGTTSYYAGFRFGAVDYSFSQPVTIAAMAFAWGLMMPLFCYIVRRHDKTI